MSVFKTTVFVGLIAFAWSGAARAADVYQDIYNAVDQKHLQQVLQETTGLVPVTIGGQTVSITNRFTPAMKTQWRAYWKQYFQSLGMDVQEMAYPTAHASTGETQGHNLEAILPGASKDTFVIIVHYDSMGPAGAETSNPGVDDDMTGMTILMETAKVLSTYKGRLQNTVRFVAADYEEWSGPGLEGARKYAAYLKGLAAQENFKIIGAVDDEQSGWNCTSDNLCDASVGGKTTYIASCSEDGAYDYKEIGDLFEAVAKQYTDLRTDRECETDDSDHYAMWEIGVPTVVFSEPYGNPHYDGAGGDTYTTIDQDYFFRMAKLGVVFAAKNVGVQ
jgi:hypothetical protein